MSLFINLLSFQGHSRHGNCLLQLKRHKEAIKAFCKAHTHASNDKEKYLTAGEVVSAAMEGEFEGRGPFSKYTKHDLREFESECGTYRTASLRCTSNNTDVGPLMKRRLSYS